MSQPVSIENHALVQVGDGPTAGVWCIVVAGGSGSRYGGLKQFEELSGQRVIDRSVETAAQTCEGVVVVLPAEFLKAEAGRFGARGRVVAGGATRAESVRAGLAVLPESAEYVLVHDGARPLASRELFRRVIEALHGGASGVIPAVHVPDTLRSVNGGTVDRESVRAVQTPQGFPFEVIRQAHSDLGEATDDAGLVERLGHQITLVEGERLNMKLTEPADLLLAASLLDTGLVDTGPVEIGG